MKLPFLSGAARGASLALISSLAIQLYAGQAAWAADENLPDAVKATLGASAAAVGASADGRVVAVFENTAEKVYLYDASAPNSSDGESGVTVACSSTKGIFVGGSEGSYLVTVVCAAGDSGGATLYQFKVEDSPSTSAQSSLVAGTVAGYVAMNSIDAATSGNGFLYLAGEGLDGVKAVYKVSASTAASSANPVARFSGVFVSNETMTRLAYESNTEVLGADSAGVIYQINSNAATPYNACTTALSGVTDLQPNDLLVVDDSTAIMLSSKTDRIYYISLDSFSCTAFDWGLDAIPLAITHLETDGVGVKANELYVSTTSRSLYRLSVTAAGTTQVLLPLDAELSGQQAAGGMISVNAVARLYSATSEGTDVIGAGPYLAFDADNWSEEQPYDLSSSSSSISVHLFSDEAVVGTSFGYSVDSGDTIFGVNPQTTTGTVNSSTDVTVNVNVTGLLSGVHRIFVYAEDALGNVGWTSFRVIVPAAAVEITAVETGDSKLFVYIKASSDTVDQYVMYISTSVFADGDDFEARLLTSDFNVTDDEGAVEANYPKTRDSDEQWPISLGDSSTLFWEDVGGGVLKYTIYPLNNDVTYYFAIAAQVSTSIGTFSEVASGMPEAVCDASCLTNDHGGACSCDANPVNDHTRFRWGAIGALLIPVSQVIRRRRRAA